ncbi:hypothetical protein [Castellaniella sp.]|uniref:hypothetical protein n=1 Tax=Castellaniella sp. TaxID=1955812 RepID=UPI002AFF32D8|nr:hypothetical protein [Castellaniella sp.]
MSAAARPFRINPDLRDCGLRATSRPKKAQPVEITIHGPGFEATRSLSIEEMRALWVWLGHAIDDAQEETDKLDEAA